MEVSASGYSWALSHIPSRVQGQCLSRLTPQSGVLKSFLLPTNTGTHETKGHATADLRDGTGLTPRFGTTQGLPV